jgi:type I restriction enzyme S subunit
MGNNNDLPQGWVWSSLESIAEIILGQSPLSSTYNEIREGLPFYQGKAEFGDIYPTPRKWCTAPKKIAEEGDILVSVRAPVGPTNICPEKSCIGRGLAAIRPRYGIPTKFILHLLRAYEQILAEQGTGTTFKAITGNQLRELEIPLPPLPEQKRIVAKIEELFTQLDAGVAELQAAKAQLQRYRQAVLKAAVEGDLTREWRAAHMGRGDPPGRPYETAEELLSRILSERREKWEAEQWEKEIERAQKKTAQAKRKATGKPARISDLTPDD